MLTSVITVNDVRGITVNEFRTITGNDIQVAPSSLRLTKFTLLATKSYIGRTRQIKIKTAGLGRSIFPRQYGSSVSRICRFPPIHMRFFLLGRDIIFTRNIFAPSQNFPGNGRKLGCAWLQMVAIRCKWLHVVANGCNWLHDIP